MMIYSLNTYVENYKDLIVSTVLVVLATTALILRLWTRRMRKTKLWVDDYTLIADLYGMRTHAAEIPRENLILLLKILVAYQLLYGTSILLGKISYLFFYRRIFVSNSFLVATWIILGTSVAWFVANILQVFLICRPFASNWDITINGVCGNRPVAFTAIGATHMVIDVAIMLLPVHFISKLQMKTSVKFGICLIFLIGLSICAISIVRMVILSKLNFNDISYDMLDSVFWTVIEPALVIVNACLPTLSPLLQDFWNMVWNKATTITGSSGTRIQLDRDEYPLSSVIDRCHIPTGSYASRIIASQQDIESQGKESPDSYSLIMGCKRNVKAVPNTEGGVAAGDVYIKKEWTVTSD